MSIGSLLDKAANLFKGKKDSLENDKLYGANEEIAAKMANLASRMSQSVDFDGQNELATDRFLQELRKEGRGF